MIFSSRIPHRGWIFSVIWLLVSGLAAFGGEPPSSNIWTEDEPPTLEEPWSERRVEGFLSRLEQEDPNRAAELRALRQKDPEKFQQVLREELQRRFRPGERPRSPEPMAGPQGPMGPGRGPEGNAPGGPGGGPGSRWLEHLQRRHDEFIQWLQKNNPELAAELEQIREKDPAQYFSRVMEARRRYDPIMETEKRNPELAKVLLEDLAMQKQRDELLKKMRRSEGAEREKLLKELKTLVSQRFDLIIRKKTLQYQELEERLKRLQQEIEKRRSEIDKLKGSKEQAVEEHVKELTAQVEKISWD
jgi:hypothetical protein